MPDGQPKQSVKTKTAAEGSPAESRKSTEYRLCVLLSQQSFTGDGSRARHERDQPCAPGSGVAGEQFVEVAAVI